jgi:predicted nucleic acid-binding protein
MKVGYVDTSYLVAIAFGERGTAEFRRRLDRFDEILSANLLEAELRATFAREEVPYDADQIAGLSWVVPDRPLSAEIGRALAAGYLKGADLWHIAAALYVADDPSAITFLTLDPPQREVAEALGFKT